MKRILRILAGLSVCGPCFSAPPVVDNERVTVWNATTVLPPSAHDFVVVFLAHRGTATFGRKGESPGKSGEPTVVIELKDHVVAPLANHSGYPDAFPRPRVKKLFENERVVLWSYRWNPGEPTPMHFHDKDTLVVFEDLGSLKSTTPDGRSVTTLSKPGDIRYSLRDRSHSELLVSGAESAVITELK
jgi:hypothetical protein